MQNRERYSEAVKFSQVLVLFILKMFGATI